ncbi:hypothetical protein STRCR_0446 [Streptococcus criceti HS-6]|uniref:Uncharacterized protein n=1 Tax=Streptococcus criceti HS-6 TaxID=873449 RepID=G5JPZ9_STRCG|nr:hypothetical protein STRCR_0446 [Streptococcus criceti HS-6]
MGVKWSGERPFQVTTLKSGRGENQNFQFFGLILLPFLFAGKKEILIFV